MDTTRSTRAPGAGDDDPRAIPAPTLLFIPDLARELGGLTLSAARRAVLRGECGPYVRIGRRLAVRREAFLDALKDREHDPRQGSNGGAR